MAETLPALEHLTVCGSPLDTLSCLLRAIAELMGGDDLETGLERVARELAASIPFESFAIWLARGMEASDDGTLEQRWGLGLDPEERRFSRRSFGEGVVGRAALERRAQRTEGENGQGSRLALPLLARDRLIGVLELATARERAFDDGHEEIFSVLAPNLAVAIENALLYRKMREDERRLEDDLQAAREIHHHLLPRKTPWVPGLQTAVAYVPARHLGGDVYDFLPYGAGRTAIAVGDVAGKGTGAALYGSLVVGMLRGLVGENRRDPAAVLTHLNEDLYELGVTQRFIALALGIFDRRDLTLQLASSGLPYPVLLRGGEIEEIEVKGVPLGILGGMSYRQIELQLEVGDVVVFATDGIEETLDGCGEVFGPERQHEVLRELAGGSAREIVDGLLEATDRFRNRPAPCGPPEPSDDRTVVAIKVAG